METELKNVMANIFSIDPEEINDQSSIENLDGWESINHLNLIMAIEETFSIIIEDDEMEKMTDYRAIKDIVKSKI